MDHDMWISIIFLTFHLFTDIEGEEREEKKLKKMLITHATSIALEMKH